MCRAPAGLVRQSIEFIESDTSEKRDGDRPAGTSDKRGQNAGDDNADGADGSLPHDLFGSEGGCGDVAESAFPLAKFADGGFQFVRPEIGPEDRAEVELGK
jgi:hypothetical protein